ncbi:MAG: DNA-binding protein [Firmicutes bacterium HGW-Firmicutes-13]|nr:MAG: DNA-binding protein [Firmicutes bacterium HGW-Firmicutes-13]
MIRNRVQVLCEQDRVDGAKCLGWAWAIPKDAPKPADARVKREDRQETKIIQREH